MSLISKVFAKLHKIESEQFVLWSLLLFLSLPVVLFNLGNEDNQQFIYLAESFLQGETHIDERYVEEEPIDYSYFDGKYYWPEAPFSAVVMMPFVALFGDGFLQGYLQIVLLPLILFLVFLFVENSPIKSGKYTILQTPKKIKAILIFY